MKLYRVQTADEYQTFVKDILSRDQPVYVYESDEYPNIILLADHSVESPDREIEELIKEIKDYEKDEAVLDSLDADELLFDYEDDDELGLIL